MISHVRRVSLFVAFVVVVVSAWTTTADAAAPQTTAASQVTLLYVDVMSPTDILVHGTATCGQPSGQADLLVTGVQVADFRFGTGNATIPCGIGPVGWSVIVTAYPDWHRGMVTVNAILADATGGASDSRNFYV